MATSPEQLPDGMPSTEEKYRWQHTAGMAASACLGYILPELMYLASHGSLDYRTDARWRQDAAVFFFLSYMICPYLIGLAIERVENALDNKRIPK